MSALFTDPNRKCVACGNRAGVWPNDEDRVATCPDCGAKQEPSAITAPHELAVEYIDRSISIQVALGYDPPTAERRAAAIEAAEREFWKLGRLDAA